MGLLIADYKDLSRIEILKAQPDELSVTIDKVFIKKDVTNFIDTYTKSDQHRKPWHSLSLARDSALT